MECKDNEVDITRYKQKSIIGVSLSTVIFILFIFIMIYYFRGAAVSAVVKNSNGKHTSSAAYEEQIANEAKKHGKEETTSSFGSIDKAFEKVKSAINTEMIAAILAAGVVIGFNTYIMTPIILMMIPYNDINKIIKVPGNPQIYNFSPGQFLIALFGFVLSLVLVFSLSSLFSKIGIKVNIYFFTVAVFLLLLLILIWNIYIAVTVNNQETCLPSNVVLDPFGIVIKDATSPISASSLRRALKFEKPSEPEFKPFGVF